MRIDDDMNKEVHQIITVFFCFFLTHNYTQMILTNMKAASFGSSELTGHTARGTLLAIWGRSFAVEDAGADVFILYGAP